MKKFAYIEKIIPLIRNIFIPSIIFAVGLLSFYISAPFSQSTNYTFHILFYIFSFGCFLTLLYFNQNKPVFIILCISLAYILLNFIKIRLGTSFLSSSFYLNLYFFTPLNLAIFYFWPRRRLLCRTNIYLLLALFFQYALAEHLTNSEIALGFSAYPYLLGNILFAFIIIACFANAIRSGNNNDYAFFFSFLSVFFAFYYADNSSAPSLFFFCAILCISISIAQNLYNETYKDSLTDLASRNSYMIHAKNFPLKYSIGIISIDDFDKIGESFGKRVRNILTKLIANKISELEKDESIYRYSPDEFVIVYKNMDKNETFERLEIIRRAIAGASFLYNPKRKELKLTVSACVSEKKRSDASSVEVLVRAHKVLQKTRNFSHNVTSKA